MFLRGSRRNRSLRFWCARAKVQLISWARHGDVLNVLIGFGKIGALAREQHTIRRAKIHRVIQGGKPRMGTAWAIYAIAIAWSA